MSVWYRSIVDRLWFSTAAVAQQRLKEWDFDVGLFGKRHSLSHRYAGLAHLGGLTALETLSLEFAEQVTDAGLAHLTGVTTLERLGLAYTQITDAGLAHLSGLTTLVPLFLYNTPVTDAGLAHLSGLTALVELYLSDTQVTAAGVAELQKALPDCRISS